MRFERFGFKAPRKAQKQGKPLYSAAPEPYAGSLMLLVAAALDEELKTGLGVCRQKRKIPGLKTSVWAAERKGKQIAFLKAGVGPKRAAASLEEALRTLQCSHILVIGYAGALDPELKLGDMVAVCRALAFSLDDANHDWDHVRLDGSYNLINSGTLAQAAKASGLAACTGNAMTSAYVLGDPAHKRLLYEKFHAAIVDMETAALARVAASRGIPLSCIRVVSDEAADSFLAPFSYDPATRLPARARKLVGAGMARIYREWKTNTRVARTNLARFLDGYL